jgi:hypothetical protein
MKGERWDMPGAVAAEGPGVDGVMVRCIGTADGAVLVGAGAESVRLPRLPMELPLPERASASPGASAREKAARAAMAKLVRRMA